MKDEERDAFAPHITKPSSALRSSPTGPSARERQARVVILSLPGIVAIGGCNAIVGCSCCVVQVRHPGTPVLVLLLLLCDVGIHWRSC